MNQYRIGNWFLGGFQITNTFRHVGGNKPGRLTLVQKYPGWIFLYTDLPWGKHWIKVSLRQLEHDRVEDAIMKLGFPLME